MIRSSFPSAVQGTLALSSVLSKITECTGMDNPTGIPYHPAVTATVTVALQSSLIKSSKKNETF